MRLFFRQFDPVLSLRLDAVHARLVPRHGIRGNAACCLADMLFSLGLLVIRPIGFTRDMHAVSVWIADGLKGKEVAVAQGEMQAEPAAL